MSQSLWPGVESRMSKDRGVCGFPAPSVPIRVHLRLRVFLLFGLLAVCDPIAHADVVTLPENGIQWRPLADLLTGLDAAAAGYSREASTLQKEDIAEKVKAHASKLLENKHMAIQAIVTDVRMPKEGRVTIHFNDLDLGSYGQRKDTKLYVQPSGQLDIELPREQALKIEKGMIIKVGGQVQFAPAVKNRFGAILQGMLGLTVISLRPDGRAVGTISLNNYQVRFFPAAK